MEAKKKPAIRFIGFTDGWKSRKLSDIAKRVTRKNSELQSTLPLTISSQYGLVDQITYFNNRIASQNIRGYYLIKNGEFAYNKSSSDGFPFGTVKRLDNYDMGVLSTLYIIFALKDDSVSSQFIVSYYDTDYWHKQVSERAAEGARNHGLLNISADDFLDTELSFPSKSKEQEFVALYLQNLDNLISFAQQKYDKLLTFKKSMLKKMFPKAGATVPEVRFGAFTGEWSFLPFSKVFEEYSEKNHAELPALTIIQGFGTVKREESGRSIQYDESGLKNYKLVREGDFIVHLRSFEGGLEKANSDGIVSPAYHLFHGENTDTGFYYAYFRSRRFVDVQLKPHVYGIRDGRSIDIEGMKTILIPCPSLPEQQKISQFLKNIDDLIANSQAELVKLKNIKKALLDKMFV